MLVYEELCSFGTTQHTDSTVPCAPVHLACLGSTDTRVIFSLPLLYKMLQRRSFWVRVCEGGYLSAGLKGGCFSQGGLSFPSI